MVEVIFRYLCRREEKRPPTFVRINSAMPQPPQLGLHVNPDGAQWYEVQQVRWHRSSPETFEVFVSKVGDANPLQPSVTHADMLLLGWLDEPA
jgi:hypothetical protein